ncbi:MAG: hypothetical protein H0V93_04620 [Euzebyales bacterium]|nr:hypothetical protein [Euzebyales bacterium]
MTPTISIPHPRARELTVAPTFDRADRLLLPYGATSAQAAGRLRTATSRLRRVTG